MITTNATLTHKYDSPSGQVSFVVFQVEEMFTFLEGQFMMLEMECHGKVIKRPYSIATTNKQLQENKTIGFVVKKTAEKGMSDHLTQCMQLGEQLQLKGPVGHYTDPKNHPNYMFVSVGSGLSPNVALFQHLVYESNRGNSIVNIFGERFYDHIVPELEDIFTGHGQSKVTNFFCLSQEKNIPSRYTQGYVQDHLEKALSLLGTETTCFLCGKPEMVDDVRVKLQHFGIDKEDIVFEKY